MVTPARYAVDQRKVFVAVAACTALCAYPFLSQKPKDDAPKPQHPKKKSTREERLEWMRSDEMPAK